MLILRLLLLIIFTVLQCEDGSFRVESGSVVYTLSDFPPSAEPKQPMQRQCVRKSQKEAVEGLLVCAQRVLTVSLSELFSSD